MARVPVGIQAFCNELATHTRTHTTATAANGVAAREALSLYLFYLRSAAGPGPAGLLDGHGDYGVRGDA